jgi:hypothetical protein
MTTLQDYGQNKGSEIVMISGNERTRQTTKEREIFNELVPASNSS